MRSKSIVAKPLMVTKGVTCRPHPILKETQTEDPPPPGELYKFNRFGLALHGRKALPSETQLLV
jgi:hypothetical protein